MSEFLDKLFDVNLDVNKRMLERVDGHVFEVYFFTHLLPPFEFTLHENYYLIKDGKAIDLMYKDGESGENPINVIINGKDIGLYNPEKTYERKFYDIDIKKLKKHFKRSER